MSSGQTYPARPYVPHVLVCSCALLISENLVLRAFVPAPALVFVSVLVLGSGGICARVLIGKRRSQWALRTAGGLAALGAFALVGTLLSMRSLAVTEAASVELARTSMSSLEFTVEGDASESSTGWMCRASTRLPSGRRAGVWLVVAERPTYGERLRCVGRFARNGDDEWGRSSRARGLSGRVRAVRVMGREPAKGIVGLLAGVRARATEAIGPERGEARALMAGVVTADRAELKRQGTEDAFAAVGLSHLVAVSGSHLVVVSAGFEAALLSLGAGPVVRGVATLFVSGLYVVLCASPSSAVRSWVMLAAALAGRMVGRRAHAPSGVAVAAVVMCTLDPSCACDLGFQLSALSVCALALFSRHAEAMLGLLSPTSVLMSRLSGRGRACLAPVARMASSARSTLAASLVCQAATLGACAATFGSVSLLAPLANVVAGPVFGPIVSVGVVGCALSMVPLLGPVMGGALLWACELLCALAVLLARLMASVPYASVPVFVGPVAELAPFVVAVVMLRVWPCPTRRVLALVLGVSASCAVLVGLLGPSLVGPRLVVLDVGQGDAILVRDGRRSVLVDTGPGDAVVEALARQGVFSLDAVVLTHLHDDHVGGLDELEGLVRVGSVIVAEGVRGGMSSELNGIVQRLTGSEPIEIGEGDALRVGDFALRVLWPRSPVTGAENEHSLCLLLEYGSHAARLERAESGGSAAPDEPTLSALLTGDAEAEVMKEIVGQAGDIDVLKVGHHGSAASIEDGEARRLAAEVAVASAGEGNSYGHPRAACVETLEASGATFLCTKDVGDVTVRPGRDGPIVSCARLAA
ncbi:ComEC/Rec2 family competence protein [uncultured Parolsenella sp.]|uniref:ComEC/Rec2 family competence protein n=1 Tax=uncultured Parolsenella sp. TaxID=2083008 RepID=UPI0027D95961|nr:ComEC/Rec2 family competence protein [uncultured Parolsenella sp.]